MSDKLLEATRLAISAAIDEANNDMCRLTYSERLTLYAQAALTAHAEFTKGKVLVERGDLVELAAVTWDNYKEACDEIRFATKWAESVLQNIDEGTDT